MNVRHCVGAGSGEGPPAASQRQLWWATEVGYAQSLTLIIGLRLVTALLLLLLTLGLWSPRFASDARLAQILLISGVSLGFASSCLMALVAPSSHDQHFFFSGILLTTLASFALFGLGTRSAMDVLRLVPAQAPSLPVLIFSGETSNLADHGRLVGLHILRKPVATRDLLQALRLSLEMAVQPSPSTRKISSP